MSDPEILWQDTTVIDDKAMATTVLTQHEELGGEMYFAITQSDFDGEVDVVLLSRSQIAALSSFTKGH